MSERTKLLLILAIFLLFYFVPFGQVRMQNALMEAFYMLQDYARLHVILCLVPAFFIAGAISNFVSQAAVMKYFGARANKFLAYSVASVSGTILAVCSCTVLPIFASIYQRGAGIGPATAFLYSGPAINVLAIILTARVLGLELGVTRAVGAIAFSVIIGLLMHFIFRKEELNKQNSQDIVIPEEAKGSRSLLKNTIYFAVMCGILVFANWGKDESILLWQSIYNVKWFISGGLIVILAFILTKWFRRSELGFWVDSSWGFAKQIFPLLFAGVFVSGLLLGRPGHQALIPSEWIQYLVGGNSLWSNFFASFAGALMYFATLTEIPILQGLIGSGMGKGPALALLLAGPALSLPSMLVLRSIMGTKKTLVYVGLVVIMATITGMIYGAWI
ncbi:MAG: permease [Candidatus Brocadiia bacterium]